MILAKKRENVYHINIDIRLLYVVVMRKFNKVKPVNKILFDR